MLYERTSIIVTKTLAKNDPVLRPQIRADNLSALYCVSKRTLY